MHQILQEDVPYAVVLLRGISNKFWLSDLVLKLCFSLLWVSLTNVLASSLSWSSWCINRQFCSETRPLNLKLVSAIFYFFHQMIALQKLWKIIFISSKNLFLLSRYSFFLYFCTPPFFSLSAIALRDDRRWILKFMTSSIV